MNSAAGGASRDAVRVIVQGDARGLTETFDDGDAAEDVGFVTLGDAPVPVARIDALTPRQGLLVTPGLDGAILECTLVYDVLILAGQGAWTGLLQTDPPSTDFGAATVLEAPEGARYDHSDAADSLVIREGGDVDMAGRVRGRQVTRPRSRRNSASRRLRRVPAPDRGCRFRTRGIRVRIRG